MAVAGCIASAEAQERQSVDLELVLALDVSSSVSAPEFDLQRRGLAEAFLHPDVVAAVQAVGDHGIAVTVVQWSGNRIQSTSVDWTVLTDAKSAAAFAAAVAQMERLFVGATGLGGAIRFSLRSLEENRFEGLRKAIDVSGDGYAGLSPRRERDRALERGATINGLAILNEQPDLGVYYREHVVGGPGSFVISIVDFADFGDAIRDKLIREIKEQKIAAAGDAPLE